MQQRDPVCGITIDTVSAVMSAGETGANYFCSIECRDRFNANPDRYNGSERGPAGSAPARHNGSLR